MIAYLFYVAVFLTVCLGFYYLLLRGLTYYRINRYVLLSCLVLAFVLPLVPVPQMLSFEVPAITPLIRSESIETTTYSTTPIEPAFNWLWAISYLYWFGVAVFAINFVVQALTLVYRSRKAEVIRDGRYRIVELTIDQAPCSFGSYIFINPEKYDWDTYNRILQHEKIHVQGRHSIDLTLTELLLVFQWFNPFAWLYRKAIEDNLEFLADDKMIQEHRVDPEAYQWSLLQVSAPNYAVRLTTNYNQSLLRKRIIMMDSKRSNVHSLWKYAMLVPVLALLVAGLNPLLSARAQQPRSYDTSGYQKAYWKADGYTAKDRAKIEKKEAARYDRITADFLRDGLIKTTSPMSFSLSRHELIINGQKQDNAIFQRYLRTYGPEMGPGEWTWSRRTGQ